MEISPRASSADERRSGADFDAQQPVYSAFDPRFNVVSLPYLFDSVEDADAKLDGEAGLKMDEILSSYGLHCMGMAENGFRQLTNSVRPVHSVEDMKNPESTWLVQTF